ncbi:MAG TPA: glycosyltransferase [Acidimicrobiia bacterium]|nr:glycosyltransferase [Acidimicrobiia bacterium]
MSGQPADLRVSVILTVRDEAASIESLIRSLFGAERQPDEVVVSDAGSSDGTRSRLDALAAEFDRLVVLDVRGNRSRGRNAAISAATHDVIACTDGGCVPEPDWLQELVEPFAHGAEWVAGFYRPVGETTKQVCIGLTMVYVLEEAMRPGFLPSARSMAFTRAAWETVGGFPEDLVVSEDTAFDEALDAAGYEMVFRPEAVVGWHPPATLAAGARVLWAWSRSDGLAGIRSHAYVALGRIVSLSALLTATGLIVAPPLAPLGLIPLLLLLWRNTRYKYRWARGASRFFWIPAAWYVGLIARLGGFASGWVARRRQGPRR